jgi:hypothetical protein
VIIQEEVLSLFVKGYVRQEWEEIYSHYCQYIKAEGPMLTADELGCLAEHWGIRLDIKFDKTQTYSTHPNRTDLLCVNLCNPSEIHWQVCLEPN